MSSFFGTVIWICSVVYFLRSPLLSVLLYSLEYFFTIPFPTLTYTHEGQEALMQVAGGNYIKNVLSFFVILSMFVFLLNKTWRQHILIISFTVGYLVILVVSVYAQSGRFHMPILPFEMMFAAYGISLCQDKPRWRVLYTYALVAEIGICVFWQWFKLKGQGLI